MKYLINIIKLSMKLFLYINKICINIVFIAFLISNDSLRDGFD